MQKKDIIGKLAKRNGLTTSQSIHAVEGIIEIIADALSDGQQIYIRGFGTIKTVTTPSRPARDISKGTRIIIPAAKKVKFIAYKELRDRINNAAI